jgi:hypothetical protein
MDDLVAAKELGTIVHFVVVTRLCFVNIGLVEREAVSGISCKKFVKPARVDGFEDFAIGCRAACGIL